MTSDRPRPVDRDAMVSLRRRTVAGSQAASIPPRGQSAAPLSWAQQRIWFQDRLAVGDVLPGHTDPNLNSHFSKELIGPLDAAALREAFRQIASRHRPLHAVLVTASADGLQTEAPDRSPGLRSRNLVAELGREPTAEELRAVLTAEAAAPFPVSDVLWRATRLRCGTVRHVLAFTAHHSIFDGWSMGVLLRELSVAYAAIKGGRPAGLPPLAFDYFDYAAWQRAQEMPDGEFWREYLADAPSAVGLPGARPGARQSQRRGATLHFTLDEQTTAGIRQLCGATRTTLFMALQATLAELLQRYTGADDVLLGTAVANRDTPGAEGLIGCFINVLPIRIRRDPRASVREALASCRVTCLTALEHRGVPFEQIVRVSGWPRRPGQHPLFDAMLVVNDAREGDLALDGVTATDLNVETLAAQLGLTISISVAAQSLSGTAEYDSGLYPRAVIVRLIDHWRTLIRAACAHPHAALSALPLMEVAEQEELLSAGDRAADAFTGRSVSQLIDEQVAAHPDRGAVTDDTESLTYRQLQRRVAALQHSMAAAGIRPGDVVGVAAQRCVALAVSYVAVLRAGGCLLPLDPAQPPSRLLAALADAQASAVVTDEGDGLAQASGCRLVTLRPGDEADPVDAASVGPTAPAYILFTSGSTGRPKGAVNTQAALANRLRWMQAAYPIGECDAVAQKAPASFDVSLWEFFWPLTVGARLVMAPPGAHLDQAAIASLISRQKVTVTHFVPALLHDFLEQPAARECVSLRHVFCSGEALPLALARNCRATIPAELHNLYGPTEAAIDVTAWTWEDLDEDESVPIGAPIAGVRTVVLDAQGNVVPVGVPGELCLGGVAIASGYAGQPGLTAARFVPDPVTNGGGRLYRTGDLVRWRRPGLLDYLGRLDNQVKLRGVRIEPGEIEAIASEDPAVGNCAAVLHGAEGETRRLVLHVTEVAGVPLDRDALYGRLRQRLPDAMVPSAIVTGKTLPLTASGKVDRRALAAQPLPRQAPAGATPSPEPMTHMQRIVADAWRTVLGLDEINLDANFFALGGHSLLIVRVLALIQESASVELSIRQFFENPTVLGVAAALSQAQIETAEPDVVEELLRHVQAAVADPPPAAADRVNPPSAACGSAEILTIAIPTCDRVQGLKRGLGSYLANARRHGRRLDAAVMDNSAAASTQQAYREMLGELSRAAGAEIAYAGAPEKLSWLEHCIKAGLPRAVVAFGLFGHREGPYNAANNANANLLHTVGSPIFCADDDTICEPVLPPIREAGTAVVTGNPEEDWAFTDRVAMEDAVTAVDVDFLGEQGRCLGSGDLGDQFLPGRAVALSVPSLVGDCGWASPTAYLQLSGASLTRLTSSARSYREALTTRLHARFVRRPTVATPTDGFMCTFYGADNRRLLLPYLPCTKGNDTLYGKLHALCFPDDLFAYTPLGLRHEPVEQRVFWSGEVTRGASGVDFSDALSAILLAEPPVFPSGDASAASRVRALGRHLTELARSPASFFATLDTAVRTYAEADLRSKAEVLRATDGPQEWKRDMQAFIDSRRQSLTAPEFCVPLDLRIDRGLDHARSLTRTFVHEFGQLLEWWPDIAETARSLRTNGCPLARVVPPVS